MLDFLKPITSTPEAMLFLTVALGVLLGRQKLAGFSFGNAAGTLIVGTALGAFLGVAAPDISPTLKSVAFLLFVFAVGFQSGPQFFASLGRATLPQAAIAVIVAATGLATTVVVAKLFALDQGIAIGVAAGGLTQTAMLGTAYGALNELGLSAEALQAIQGQAAVAFALTYVFGTIGVVLMCSQIGPRLIGVDLKGAAQALDTAQAKALATGDDLLDFRSLAARVFRVDAADGKTIGEIEEKFGPQAVVQRVRRGRGDLAIEPGLVLKTGDLVAVQGYRPVIVKAAAHLGKEVAAEKLVTDLLGDGAEVIVNPAFAGMTLHDAVAKVGPAGHGLFLRRIRRQSRDIPVTPSTVLMPGDTLSLTGPSDRLAEALPQIGTVMTGNNRADVAFLAFGLLVGVLIGLLTLTVDGLPVTLSAGGGALVAGLVFGWWHARRPERSNVPAAATQIMWDFGLASFCALVGLTAGPQAVAAMGSNGAMLLLSGVIVTLVPQIVGLFVGYFVMKMDPVLLMGALAGAQTQDAAMLAASDVAESPAPALGFTVPYAIANILLTILGPAVVALT